MLSIVRGDILVGFLFHKPLNKFLGLQGSAVRFGLKPKITISAIVGCNQMLNLQLRLTACIINLIMRNPDHCWYAWIAVKTGQGAKIR